MYIKNTNTPPPKKISPFYDLQYKSVECTSTEINIRQQINQNNYSKCLTKDQLCTNMSEQLSMRMHQFNSIPMWNIKQTNETEITVCTE